MRRYSDVLFVSVFGVVATLTQAAPQQPVPERKKFEVASIKECKNTDQRPPSISSPGRLGLGCWPLRRLIEDAYEVYAAGRVDLGNPQPVLPPIEGLPPWVNSARYTIDAKAATPESGAMMRGPMMQALLEERFHFRSHSETRQVDVDIMTVAKGGPKLRPAEKGACYDLDPTDLDQPEHRDKPWCAVSSRPEKQGDLLVANWYGISLDVFVKFVHPNRRPVINRTGLTGRYDIHLEWEEPTNPPVAEVGKASDPSPGASFITALRKQLGLAFKPGKGPQEFLVIDNIERPTGN